MNNADIVGIGDMKSALNKDVKLESLDYYLKLAKKLIIGHSAKFGGQWAKNALKSDDFIANIATTMMLADIKFNGKGNLPGYRKQVFLWTLMQYFRRTKKTSSKPFSIMNGVLNDTFGDSKRKLRVENIISVDNNPATVAINNERKKLVNTILNQGFITEQQKSYISMYYGISPYTKSMTMEEIAKQSGVTKQNVHNAIHRGLKSLKEYNKEEDYLE